MPLSFALDEHPRVNIVAQIKDRHTARCG